MSPDMIDPDTLYGTLEDDLIAPPASPSPSNEDLEPETPRLLILYATTTGNALDVAEQIFHMARERAYDVELKSADEYPPARTLTLP